MVCATPTNHAPKDRGIIMDASEEEEDVFVGEPAEDLKCPICFSVLSDPVQTPCGHRFCKLCIGQQLRNNPVCPIDRTSLSQENIFPDNAVRLQINRLRIRCPNHGKGCEWEGERSDKQSHLHQCTYSRGSCQLCGQLLALNLLDEHRKVCPRRQVRCQYCSASLPFCDMPQHMDTCPKFPVLCPNNCSQRSMAREAVRGHLETDCPRQPVKCDLAAFGCTDKVPRGDLGEHLQRCAITRVGVLARVVLEQRDELQRLKEELAQRDTVIQHLEETCYPAHGQFTWRIRGIRDKIHEAQQSPADSQVAVTYSPPFFTGEGGYKLCLCVYPAGDTNQNFLSLYFVVMKGPYDEILPWPFQKQVVLTLVNCQGGPHFHKEIVPDPRLHYFSRPRGEKNVGYGYPKFMPLSKLLNEDSGYVSEDSIFIRVQIYQ